MTVEETKSTVLENMDKPHPEVSSNPWLAKGSVYTAVGTVEVKSTHKVGHVYRFIRLSSDARICDLKLVFDKIAGFGGVVGFYKPQGTSGNTGYPLKKTEWSHDQNKDVLIASHEGFLGGVELDKKGSVDLLNQISASQSEKRIFELLDLEDIKHTTVDLCLTSKKVALNDGHIAMKIQYTI